MRWKAVALVLVVALSAAGGRSAAGDFVPAREGAIAERYIAVLDQQFLPDREEAGNVRQRASERARIARQVAAENGLRAKEAWGALGMFLVEATEEAARRLAEDPRIAHVEQDAEIGFSAIQSCFDRTRFNFPRANSYDPFSPQTIQCWDPQTSCADNWALDRIDQRTGSQSAHTLDGKFYFGATGQGSHIYVVDTGIVATHTEFALPGGGTRIGNGTNVSSDRPAWDTYDGSGHGTLVASVAAGRRFGVAKGAILHPVRISNDRGLSSTSLAVSGLDWVVSNVQRPAVVNLSYNFRKWAGDTSALDTAADRMVRIYGIPLVNSAGNWNQDASNFSPTAVPGAIVVAGMDWVNNQRWGADPVTGCHDNGCGTNWGPSVDLFAPATDILGALGTGESLYACIGTGTSFAAPQVAGVVAQYLQGNPAASPALIETVLIERATTGVIQGNLQFAPNRLLYTDF